MFMYVFLKGNKSFWYKNIQKISKTSQNIEIKVIPILKILLISIYTIFSYFPKISNVELLYTNLSYLFKIIIFFSTKIIFIHKS